MSPSNVLLPRGFLVIIFLSSSILSLPQQAVSEEPYPPKLSKLSVSRRALIQANNPNSTHERTHLTWPSREEISTLLLQKNQETSGDYCLIDLYLISSKEHLLQTICTHQDILPKLLGKEREAPSLERHLVTPLEPAWGVISSRTFVNLGLGSDLALELYLSEDNNPTLISEDLTKQLAFFYGLKSRILDEVVDMPPFTIVKAKSSGSKQKSSFSSTSSRRFPISPFFKWNTVGLSLKWKW